jgi:hypothetical protein
MFNIKKKKKKKCKTLHNTRSLPISINIIYKFTIAVKIFNITAELPSSLSCMGY